MLLACAFWFALLFDINIYDGKTWLKCIVMGVVIILNSVERLAAGGNMVVMERDWVSKTSLVFACYVSQTNTHEW